MAQHTRRIRSFRIWWKPFKAEILCVNSTSTVIVFVYCVCLLRTSYIIWHWVKRFTVFNNVVVSLVWVCVATGGRPFRGRSRGRRSDDSSSFRHPENNLHHRGKSFTWSISEPGGPPSGCVRGRTTRWGVQSTFTPITPTPNHSLPLTHGGLPPLTLQASRIQIPSELFRLEADIFQVRWVFSGSLRRSPPGRLHSATQPPVWGNLCGIQFRPLPPTLQLSLSTHQLHTSIGIYQGTTGTSPFSPLRTPPTANSHSRCTWCGTQFRPP